MENEQTNSAPENQEQRYVKRPWWQVWGARLLLALLLILITMYYCNIAGGGK